MNSGSNVPWDPSRYERFERERAQPFFDLLDGIVAAPGCRALDLGCGTGKLTRSLHEQTQATATLGIDKSEAMLAEAQGGDGLAFEPHDIATFDPPAPFEIVFSNAALQWLPNHPELFERIAGWVAPNGQLAVQMPANQHHPSHVIAREIAANEFDIEPRGTSVLRPDDYAAILYRLGFRPTIARLNVYLHELPDREAVVEWVAGTLLNAYRARLSESDFERFAALHRERVLDTLPDDRPFPFTFPRILLWARKRP